MEAIAKSAGAQIVITEAVAVHANLDTSGFRSQEVEVRGLDAPISVIFAERARDFVALLGRAPEMARHNPPRPRSSVG